MVKISLAECVLLSRYICEISGMDINPAKAYLFETRLGGMLDELSLPSYGALYDRALADGTKTLEQQIIDNISTNETLFFRDEKPFHLLEHKLIPDLIDKRQALCRGGPIPIRIWSAACATGQEIYSIAMVLKDLLPDMSGYDISLLGTDISAKAIAKASLGKFTSFEMGRGLPRAKQERYFTRRGNSWMVRDEIRAMVSFRRMNLLHPFGAMGRFDIILLRNVAIYFNVETRRKLFEKMCRVLAGDGYLIIGATESLSGICDHLVPRIYLKSVFYEPDPPNGRK